MDNNNYLMHFGVKGMKWGVRRYRNPDGTLTEEGRKRYGLNEHSTNRDVRRALRKSDHKNFKAVGRNYEKALINKGFFLEISCSSNQSTPDGFLITRL